MEQQEYSADFYGRPRTRHGGTPNIAEPFLCELPSPGRSIAVRSGTSARLVLLDATGERARGATWREGG